MRDPLVMKKAMPFKDVSYNRFGKWLALRPTRNNRGRLCYVCRCDCGLEAIVTKTALTGGKSRSCGCSKGRKTPRNRNNPSFGKRYSEADEYLIRQWYPKWGSAKLALMLNRSKIAILHKAREMGLECINKDKVCKRKDIWSEEEIEILRRFYPKGGTEACLQRLPLRSKNAIWVKAQKLGILLEKNVGLREAPRRNSKACSTIDIAA